MSKLLTFSLPLLILLSCQDQKNKSPEVSIDIESTSDTATLLAPGVISTSLYERDFALAPEGDEFMYTLGDYRQNKRCLVSSKWMNGKWSTPEVVSVSRVYQDIEPFYSLTEDRLYFASNRPIFNDSSRTDYNLWYADRINGKWSEPVALDSMINTRGDEFYPSLSRNGNLYFTATRENGVGREDIYIAAFSEGQFQEPIPLSVEVNSPYYEFNAFISPDEDYLLFSSYGREDDLGGGDLYISEKDSDGLWTTARHLGNQINSDKLDYCPFVDNSSKTFYFTSERQQHVEGRMESIGSMKEYAHRIENGFGNIYYVSFEALGIQ